jgi:hypothetical protein
MLLVGFNGNTFRGKLSFARGEKEKLKKTKVGGKAEEKQKRKKANLSNFNLK